MSKMEGMRFADVPIGGLFRWVWPDGSKKSIIYRKTAADNEDQGEDGRTPREVHGWTVEPITEEEAAAEGERIRRALEEEVPPNE